MRKNELIKKLKRFSGNTEISIIKCDKYLCLIIQESGEVLFYIEKEV